MHRFASTRASRSSKRTLSRVEIPGQVADSLGRYEDGGIVRRGRFAVEPEEGVVLCVEIRTIEGGMLANRIAGVRTIRLVPGKDQAIRVRRIVIRRNVDDVFATHAAARDVESGRRGKTVRDRHAARGQRLRAIRDATAFARNRGAPASGSSPAAAGAGASASRSATGASASRPTARGIAAAVSAARRSAARGPATRSSTSRGPTASGPAARRSRRSQFRRSRSHRFRSRRSRSRHSRYRPWPSHPWTSPRSSHRWRCLRCRPQILRHRPSSTSRRLNFRTL